VKRKERRLEDIYQISIRAKSTYDVIRKKKCSASEQKGGLKTLHVLLRGKLVEVTTVLIAAGILELWQNFWVDFRNNIIFFSSARLLTIWLESSN